MGKRQRQREIRQSKREEPAKEIQKESQAISLWTVLLFAVALLLVIAGVRWWIIGRYGTDVPWLDQWDAEAQGLYQPLHAGTLHLAGLFRPHNEHRIFFTRILALGLLQLNGQWDPRLQMVVNAVLYAATAAGLFLALRRRRTLRFQIFCWILLAVLGAVPYGVTNTLLGFQSQFYFLAGFSLIAIYGLVNSRPESPAWIAGALGGCAALVSMASGYAAAIAVLAVLLASLLRSPREYRQQLRSEWMTIAAACLLIAVGSYFRYGPADLSHMEAKNAGDFVRFFSACLAWPVSPMGPIGALMWLPFAAFAVNYLRKRGRNDAGERFILGIGLWVLLQAAALAMFRANSGEGIESRYMDILAFGLLANAICAAWLLNIEGKLRKFAPALAIVWAAAAGIGLYSASFNGLALQWKHDMEIRRAATAGFLAMGDQRYLDRAPPYPDANRVAALLRDPAIQPILPAGIRKPLGLSPRNGSPAADYMNGLSMPDLANVTPGMWTAAGMFSRFAVIQPGARFEYRVEKNSSLPFLLLYFVGERGGFSVTDSQNAAHKIVPLGSDGEGHHAFVFCPTRECVLSGSAGGSRLAIMEPKEIGWLSILALAAAIGGPFVFILGVVAFAGAVAVSQRPSGSPRVSESS